MLKDLNAPRGGGQPNNGITVNVTKEQMKSCETVKCTCGNNTFIAAMAFKKVPGILLGTGSESQILPIQGLMVCSKCGELAPFCKEDKGLTELLGE